jgi:hypothetical protein
MAASRRSDAAGPQLRARHAGGPRAGPQRRAHLPWCWCCRTRTAPEGRPPPPPAAAGSCPAQGPPRPARGCRLQRQRLAPISAAAATAIGTSAQHPASHGSRAWGQARAQGQGQAACPPSSAPADSSRQHRPSRPGQGVSAGRSPPPAPLTSDGHPVGVAHILAHAAKQGQQHARLDQLVAEDGGAEGVYQVLELLALQLLGELDDEGKVLEEGRRGGGGGGAGAGSMGWQLHGAGQHEPPQGRDGSSGPLSWQRWKLCTALQARGRARPP